MLDKTQPLWLPQGSIRALISLGATAAFLLGEISWEPAAVVWLFYFKDRPNQASQSRED